MGASNVGCLTSEPIPFQDQFHGGHDAGLQLSWDLRADCKASLLPDIEEVACSSASARQMRSCHTGTRAAAKGYCTIPGLLHNLVAGGRVGARGGYLGWHEQTVSRPLPHHELA